MKLSKREKEAIRTVIKLGTIWGYGNLIGWLKWAWAKDLKNKYGGSWDKHIKSTDVDAYPERVDFENQ